MGACSSQKQIRDFEIMIKQKEKRLEKIDSDIQKLEELQEQQTEQGLERQAQLTKEKTNKLYTEQKLLQQFLIDHQKQQVKIKDAEIQQNGARDLVLTNKVVLTQNQKENVDLKRAQELQQKIDKLKQKREALADSSEDQNVEEDQELEEYKQRNQERLRKLREEKENQSKAKKIETENNKVPDLLYPDIQKEQFIPVKHIQNQNQYKSIQQQYQSQGAIK